MVDNKLWPGEDIIDEWAWQNEDQKVVWILFDFVPSSAAGCIRVRLKRNKKNIGQNKFGRTNSTDNRAR